MSDPKLSIPTIENVQVPAELADHDAAREVARLHDVFQDARRQLRSLTSGLADARGADRVALAEAMAAGKPDPGDKALATLRQQIESQQRRVVGLADAWRVAFNRLLKLIAEEGPAWAAQAEADLEAATQPVADGLSELFAALDEVTRLRAWHRWIERACDPGRSSRQSLPTAIVGGMPLTVYTTPVSPDVLANAIRSWASPEAYEKHRGLSK